MSGGRYNYVYSKVLEFADSLDYEGNCDAAPPILRKAFAEHCRLVAEAMRACEWNDSCDGHNKELELIINILNPNKTQIIMQAAKETLLKAANDVIKSLEVI